MSLGSFLNSMPCFPLIKPRKRATKTEGSARGSIRIIGLGQSSLTGSIAGVNVKYLIKLFHFFKLHFLWLPLVSVYMFPVEPNFKDSSTLFIYQGNCLVPPWPWACRWWWRPTEGSRDPSKSLSCTAVIKTATTWTLLWFCQFIGVSKYLLESTVFRAI